MAEKFCMVVSEGSFDKAMMPLIMGTTAASMGMEVHVFYTFFGLKLLKKGVRPKLPGLMSLFTGMMEKKMKKINMPGYQEMLAQAKDLGVNFYACSTVDGTPRHEEGGADRRDEDPGRLRVPEPRRGLQDDPVHRLRMIP